MFEPPMLDSPRVFEADGKSVAVAFTRDTWLVAYRTAKADVEEPAEFVLQRLSRDGRANGPASAMRIADQTSNHYDPEPLLTASGEGFVLVAPSPAGEHRAHVHWLSPELSELRPAADLGYQFHVLSSGSVATIPGLVAVSLSTPYASHFSLVDADGQVRTHEIRGGGKQGAYEALTATPTSIIASWFLPAPESSLFVQSFSSLNEQPRQLKVEEWQWVTFRVGGQVLGARTVSGVIEVAPLPQPF
jgi:hypothetical protein